MSITKETIGAILNFDPGRVVVEGQRIDLGRVDGHNVVYGNYPIHERLICDPDEPLIFSWRTKPVVALETRDENGQLETCRKLAYATDIKSLGPLAERVAEYLRVLKAS